MLVETAGNDNMLAKKWQAIHYCLWANINKLSRERQIMNFSIPDKKTTLSMLASVGALVLVLQQGPAGFTGSAQAQSHSQQVFANSDYGYCDAKKVAAVWNVGIGKAKAVIGDKIIGNITHLIDADIASTAGQVYCSWEDLQMSYNDAVALGNFWGRQPHEAKTKASNMATQMGKKELLQLILRENGYRISMNKPLPPQNFRTGGTFRLAGSTANQYTANLWHSPTLPASRL